MSGQWNNKPSISMSNVNWGKSLGYVDEVYAMAEYIMKYKEGYKNAMGRQVACLVKKLEENTNELEDQEDTQDEVASPGNENNASSESLPNVFFDDRMIEIKSVMFRTRPVKLEVHPLILIQPHPLRLLV